jgi:16S rRNA (cytidine1402-2'-O)-methyltransferase
VTAALSASGFPSARFVFEGFLPRKGRARGERLAALARDERTAVLFEAPARAAATLAELAGLLGARRAVAAREITKRFEEFARGTLADLAAHFAESPPRGELVLVIEGAADGDPAPKAAAVDAVRRAVELVRGGMRLSAAVQQVAREERIDRRELYRRVLEARGEPS